MDIILEEIFVGRKKELLMMENIWKRVLLNLKNEHMAYTILNAPGIGKTTLIRKYGEIIEERGEGIHFNFVCSKNYTTIDGLHRGMITSFMTTIKNNKKNIVKYINKNEDENEDENEIKYTLEDFDYIYEKIRMIMNNKIIYDDVIELIERISMIIPVFFTSDEIQVFKDKNFTEDKTEETVLHYYSGILKAFHNSRVLLVLTGTQYHILREIGDTIGSPLKGKVDPKIISPLSSEDIYDFIIELKNILPEYISENSIEFLHYYLQSFSGGHGRTIRKITEHFYEFYSNYKDILEYNKFKEIMTNNVTKIIEVTVLSNEKTDKFRELQSQKYFEIVRKWINKGLYNNLRLGYSPRNNNAIEQIILDKIVFKFMTMGIIVQNGNQDYFITSYFHFKIFVTIIVGKYEQFILEIFSSKFLRSIIGGKSGFGYTFENILLAIIIINSNKVNNFPVQTNKIEKINIQLNYTELEFQNGLMYHTPDTRNIDGITLIEDRLIVLQITTAVKVPETKVKEFHNELNIIRMETGKEVEGWFISLFNIEFEILEDLKLIQGRDLINFMNEEVYNKMLEIKKEL